MSSRLQQRRARLVAEYGFDFPEDFYRFWEFCNRLSPLDPLHALQNVGITLVGPFEMLAGRFDGRVTRYSLLLHWRYYDDPPEFFTMLYGGDGLHFGYFLDDPERGEGCVSSYYAGDAFELAVDGDTLFEAARLNLEYYYRDNEGDRELGLKDRTEHAAERESLARLRTRLLEYATAKRPEVGEEYTDRYAGVSSREDRIVAKTIEGVGIVVPPATYRPLSVPGRKLWARLRRTRDPVELVEEARAALRDGFPGTALKLGKDLWATTGSLKAAYAAELLDAAYAALGRETLRRVLQTHLANRKLKSVDILEEEEG
jgi:hypothetical protein